MKGTDMHMLRTVQINNVAQRNIATYEGISPDATEFTEATITLGGITHWGYGETPEDAIYKMWLMVFAEMQMYQHIVDTETSYTTWYQHQVAAMTTALQKAWVIV